MKYVLGTLSLPRSLLQEGTRQYSFVLSKIFVYINSQRTKPFSVEENVSEPKNDVVRRCNILCAMYL